MALFRLIRTAKLGLRCLKAFQIKVKVAIKETAVDKLMLIVIQR